MTKSCSHRLCIVNSVLKASDCDSATYFAKITRAHGWITFCLFKGKTNNNTNISTSYKLDVTVFGLRPHTITANTIVGLDVYLLNIRFIWS